MAPLYHTVSLAKEAADETGKYRVAESAEERGKSENQRHNKEKRNFVCRACPGKLPRGFRKGFLRLFEWRGFYYRLGRRLRACTGNTGVRGRRYCLLLDGIRHHLCFRDDTHRFRLVFFGF